MSAPLNGSTNTTPDVNTSTGASSLVSATEETAETIEAIMPGVDFHVLRSEISMQQVLDQLSFQPTSRAASQLPAAAGPVHGSSSTNSRSFSVNLETGRYYCHKCHSHGNQLELWAAVHQLPMYEAALALCRALGRDVPWINRW